MPWETVIGLEVHVQLATRSKIFSAAATRFGAEPNSQACAIDLAMPGTLPLVNAEAIRLAVLFGLAIGAEISHRCVFDRKNYFYPDLPKGYQISQFHHPVVGKGKVEIQLADGSGKFIGITRAHLEEDAGKSLHDVFQDRSGIDLNRAGTPLLEIVSEPDLGSAVEAVTYLKTIHSLVTYLGVSDGNMAEGSMRCDVNLSLRPAGSEKLGVRTEIKNVNSFRFVEKAIHIEQQRQLNILEAGGQIEQETRLYDPERNETRPMRSKEVANDYRYFPEPDLLPVLIDRDYIEQLRDSLPELPRQKRARFVQDYQLSAYDALVLSSSRALADYFENVVKTCGNPKLAANWVQVELLGQLHRAGLEIEDSPVSAAGLGELITRILDQSISGKIAKQVFEGMWSGRGTADQIIAASGLQQVSDSGKLEAMVDQVITQHPAQVEKYLAADPGKRKKMLGFFVGQVMKASRGQAHPQLVNEWLHKKLTTGQE